MKINCHCHVFNLQTIFSPGAKDIIKKRLEDMEIPSFFIETTIWLLEQIVKNPSLGSDPAKIYHHLTKRFIGFNSVLKTEYQKAIEPLAAEDNSGWFENKLESVFSQLTNLKQRTNIDAWTETAVDWLKFIYTALMPSIDMITDHLLNQLDPDDIIVPLMMDIDPWENKLYQQQIEGTFNQCVRYPGRVLPFLAVHPERKNVEEILQNELDKGHFVGVKLYPSLGYRIDSPKTRYIIKRCNENDTPIIMHSNCGGFYAEEEYRTYGHPRFWWDLLDQFSSLKICFGHFGGDDFYPLSNDKPCAEKSWSDEILLLMKTYSGRVFADVSYQTRPMELEWKPSLTNHYDRYMKKLTGYLSDPDYGSQILWGTDFWLVQKRVDEKSYSDYFQSRILEPLFNRMAQDNPLRFLGLDAPDKAKNMVRHIEYLQSRKSDLDISKSARWIRDKMEIMN